MNGDTEYDNMDEDSPFKVGPAGAGFVKDDVVKRPQHTFTKSVEDERDRVIYRALKVKLNVLGVMPSREECTYLSVNRLSTQFVGLPKMQRTVMDATTFRECWSIYMGTASPLCHQ